MKMVGKKIRAYREFRGLNQIQLAELSGINVGTIRKYELGLRNPKPEQLERIASALGLNVSIFLDFNIETVGDVLSLLFAIDDSVDLSLSEPNPEDKSSTAIAFTFKNHTLQDFIKKWCQFKNVYEKEKKEILAIEDETKRQEEFDKLEAVPQNVLVQRGHIEGLRIHEVVQVAVVIAVLGVLALHGAVFKLGTGVEGLLTDGAGHYVLVLGTHESGTLAGFDVLEVHNQHGLAVHLEHNTLTEIACRNRHS